MSTQRRIALLSVMLAALLAAFAAGTQVGERVATNADVTVSIGRPQPPIFN
jgi:hypothetical protein